MAAGPGRRCAGLPAELDVISDRVLAGRFYALDRKCGDLYRSDDGGAHFAVKHEGMRGGRVFASPAGAGDVWVASEEKGVEWSVDGGETFRGIAGMGKCWAIGFGKEAPGKAYPAVYAVGEIASVKGVFRSDDGAGTWVRINDDAHQYGWIGQTVIGDPQVYGL